MVVIKDFEEQYAKEISEMILKNLYEIYIKDHGKEIIDRISKHFTKEEIESSFPHRGKSLVALDSGSVVGTASVSPFKGDVTGTKYIVLTVFVKMGKQHQGIGKMLMAEIEQYAQVVGAKQLMVFSSIYGCEFYRKLGYDYLDGKRVLNQEKEYTLVKYL